MGVLGKDLFDLHRPQTNTKVEFGASAYWVEDRPEPQPYGAVLTEILNLDVAPFQELLDQLNTAVQEKSDNILRAYMDMKKGLASLPLYRLYLEDFRVFGDMQIEEFAVGDAQDAFAEFIMQEENDLPAFMQQQINDIRLIQERYAWFLDGVFADVVFEKKKGQKKIPLAPMIYSRGFEAFISGVSLDESPETDAPPVKTQYRIRGEKENAEIVEKIYFDRLLDFVYVEFMKGLQKGFVPKRCANCGRWFLQTPGATFAYCAGSVPEDPSKTCREIGAASSFKDKVANNEVWQVQQRAYKKYYARTMRKDMTKAEFEAWTRDAEQKRDAALEPYVRAATEEDRQRIADALAEELNKL